MSVHVVSWALRHSHSKLGDRLVLLVLADHAKTDGTSAWPSVATIAREANLSERQAQRCLRNLVELGEIAQTGKTKTGTNVYAVTGYIAHEGGDNLSPPAAEGGDTHVTGGVTPMSPEPSLEPSSAHVTANAVTLAGRQRRAPWKVDRKTVTEPEEMMARSVLAEWNSQTGQRLTAKDWVAMIVMRVREHPELGIVEHGQIIEQALHDPWWKGPASPSVVYGNGALFERSMQENRGGPRKVPRRYGRGMTSAEMREIEPERIEAAKQKLGLSGGG